MTSARDFARHARSNEFGHRLAFYLQNRWIMKRTDKGFDPIVGRVYGGDGSATYQLAGRPHDECPVHGHPNIKAAFEAAVKILESRSKSHDDN